MDVPSTEDWSRRNDSPAVLSLFEGGGEMGARMREIGWSQTSLGPAELWPQSLKTAVHILLTSRFQMWMGVGAGACVLLQ